MIYKYILMLAWASNGTGYTMQEFDSKHDCIAALEWAKQMGEKRGGLLGGKCIEKRSGMQ